MITHKDAARFESWLREDLARAATRTGETAEAAAFTLANVLRLLAIATSDAYGDPATEEEAG